MAVDRSQGATMWMNAAFGLAFAVVPILFQIHDVFTFIGVESSLFLAFGIFGFCRQKATRERCVICRSDVESIFLATTATTARRGRCARAVPAFS
jgi:hypothetical protein